MGADVIVSDSDDSDSGMLGDFMPEELQELNRPPMLRQSHLRLIIKHFPGLAKGGFAYDICKGFHL